MLRYIPLLLLVEGASANINWQNYGSYTENDCDITSHPWRLTIPATGVVENATATNMTNTYCCSADWETANSSFSSDDYGNFIQDYCHTNQDPCAVMDETHQCCGTALEGNSIGTVCMSSGYYCGYHYLFQWCEPAPPAEESGLSAGATAGIVVGSILGPFVAGFAGFALGYGSA